MRTPFIIGNWKMNMDTEKVRDFSEKLKKIDLNENVRAGICAPYIFLKEMLDEFADKNIKIGAQNAHWEDSGAFTGEISAEMLRQIGVNLCIIGHSERREYFGETDDTVNKKLIKLFEKEMIPVLCVGENIDMREAGRHKEVVDKQIKRDLASIDKDKVSKMVIAYEPIWAIGTGKSATPEQAQEMCKHIRSIIGTLYDSDTAGSVTIQYGGSMNPDNVKELMNMPDIDGGLIGGASLDAEKFSKLINFEN